MLRSGLLVKVRVISLGDGYMLRLAVGIKVEDRVIGSGHRVIGV